jgi:phospholipid-translocating ATPase
MPTDQRAVFPIFGATTPQIAMLPLVTILVITGLKDGVEDSRRHALDNEVNNSAVTRLSDWKNVNVPDDVRTLWEKIMMKPPRTKVSKGVKKLRAREGDFSTEFLYPSYGSNNPSQQSVDQLPMVTYADQPGKDLPGKDTDVESLAHTITTTDGAAHRMESSRSRSYTINSFSTAAPSYRQTGGSQGVVDYSLQAPGTARWERTLWKKLEVGDVVLLKENDSVPADMVVLSSSDADGICFVETKNLDGETNLKPRRCLRATMSIQSEEDLEHAQFTIESEPPHANLYSYSAVLRYNAKATAGQKATEKQEAVTINELLLRGCTVRNTAWVIGLVIFTGADSKIMLNQGDTPSKRSRIERETNYNVLANFVLLAIMCLVCGIADGIYIDRDATSADFFELGNDGATSVVAQSVINFA